MLSKHCAVFMEKQKEIRLFIWNHTAEHGGQFSVLFLLVLSWHLTHSYPLPSGNAFFPRPPDTSSLDFLLCPWLPHLGPVCWLSSPWLLTLECLRRMFYSTLICRVPGPILSSKYTHSLWNLGPYGTLKTLILTRPNKKVRWMFTFFNTLQWKAHCH